MNDHHFTRLFTYLKEFRSVVNRRFEAVHVELADVGGAIAELRAQARDHHHETMFMSHQMDRLRDAIRQIARETGVKLKAAI